VKTAVLLLLAFAISAKAVPSAGPRWSEEQKRAQREAARQLISSLKVGIAAGEKSLVVRPGNYRFDEPGSDPLFDGLQDVTIKGDGAVFWFDSRIEMRLQFRNCRNVTLRGVTIDCDPLPWYQGTITKIDRSNLTMNVAPDPGYLTPKGSELDEHDRILFFDGESNIELPVTDDCVTRMEWNGDGTLKIDNIDNENVFKNPVVYRAVQPGDKVAILADKLSGGSIALVNCSAMTLEDVTIYGSGGFAYVEQHGGGGNKYLRCELIRRPNTNRLMASKADGFHSYLMEKGPIIESCEFSHSGDDLLAIHGFYGIITEKLSPTEYRVLCPVNDILRVGSDLTVFDPRTNTDRGHAKVLTCRAEKDSKILKEARDLPAKLKAEENLSLRPLDDASVLTVTIDRDLEAQPNDLTSSGDLCGKGTVVRNSYLHDGHVRGLLAKTQDLLVENNTIKRTAFSGIVLEPEYFWLEGPANMNAHIVGNRLSRNSWSVFSRVGLTSAFGAIEIGSDFGNLFPREFVRGTFDYNIEIRDNLIKQPAGMGILVMNTNGGQITGNTIVAPFSAGVVPGYYDWSKLGGTKSPLDVRESVQLKDPFFAIFILDSKNIAVENNSILDPPPFLKGAAKFGPQTNQQ